MNPVPAIKEQQLPAVVNESATVLQIIERAARDPSVDINKMERLLAMHKEMMDRSAEKAFNAAMAECQREIRQVAPDADNPQTRSKYATYAKLDSVLRPVYTKHGFALSFGEATCEKPDTVRVTCIVSHVDGHSRTYHRDMPADGKGAKGGDVMTKTHAAGAAGSYGARYLLKGIFNVAIGEYDNDGNASSSQLDDDTFASFLKAIDEAKDEAELKDEYMAAYKTAQAAGDTQALRRFIERKDARKKALAKP